MSGSVQPDGKTYSGDLYRTNGPAFNAQPFTPLTTANLTRVGTMSLTFSSVDRGKVSYTYQGTAISKDIVQQVFGSSVAACRTMTGARAALTNFQDMWWNPSESGWGVNIAHQDDILFATLFTYDLAGSNLWLVMLAGTPQSDGSYLGDLYRTHGPAFSAQPFPPLTAANLVKVGMMRFVFADGNTGTMSYSIEGIAVVKAITRQVFSSPVPACSSSSTRSAPTTNGPTLYANHCAACHGALASSSKGGASLARVQGAIAGNVGSMGYLSTLSTTQLEAIVAALAPVAPGAAACGSCHAIPPGTGDHGRHNTRFSCSSCHGSGYSSSSVNAATHNNGIRDLIAGAGWNVASQSCTNACHGTGSWSATATLPCASCHAIPPGTGDHGRHNTRFSCSSCHGSGYSSSSVNAATHNNGIRDLIAGAGWNVASQSCTNACHGTGSWSATATLPCGSCHGVPPTTGHHSKHKSRSCSVCHGTGYDSTTVNAATHINGVKEVIASTGWNSTARTCSNSCHGRESW